MTTRFKKCTPQAKKSLYLRWGLTLLIATTSSCSTVSQNKKPHALNHSLEASQIPQINEYAKGSGLGWHLSAGDEGLQIFKGNSKETVAPEPFEYLDARTNKKNRTLTGVTLDDKNRVVLINTNAKNHNLMRSPPLNVSVEGLCLSQTDQALELFLLLDNQRALHVVIQPKKDAIKLIPLREISIPPNAEFCTVDDTSEKLFINEENIGAWVYNARAESEASREILDLITPYGSLAENAGPLAIANGYVWLAELGSPFLHKYDLDTKAKVASYSLASNIAIDSLTLNETLEASHLESGIDLKSKKTEVSGIVLDKNSGNNFKFKVIEPKKYQKNNKILSLAADQETQPVIDLGDAADDPAIWVNSTTPQDSKILGTNKQRGLMVYDLAGKKLQSLLVGRVNNVDLRQGFTLQGHPKAIAAASQRDRHSIALFSIDETTGIVTTENEIKTTLTDVYGLCMYHGLQNRVYVFINDKSGHFEQYEIKDSPKGWTGIKVREFAIASQPEGCTADDKNQRLFFGEESTGIWTIAAEPDKPTHLQKIAMVGSNLTADVEGMELYQTNDKNLLIVSSQGNDSYSIFNANPPFQYLANFRIGVNLEKAIDGASETDGLTVYSGNLGPDYPKGLLVVQDGRNIMPMEAQNFKLISWDKIERALGL